MSKKNRNRKQPTLARANNQGGATMYIPAGQLQNIFAQTFYGGNNPNLAGRDATMFSPGNPLPPQPGVDKAGKPNQFQFPIAYNTFPVDRSLGRPDIPSFQQLRTVAKLYSGITLCERTWFDMIPRMKLKISLKPEVVAQGAEEKNYQKEIAFFQKWFEKPDGRRNLHTWLRMALKEQTQIDELYVYKNRTRGGKLLGLHVIAGDTMKPLLNDWGDIPLPDDPEGGYAFQQYPWGIPGMYYTTDMMVHYQESPSADTPYGMSRVERVLMEVNQALRKKKRDLSMFTEGNLPAGLMEVPEGSGWTPDIIDAYEQSWNALIAGNPQQQVRVKFTQPGMKFVKLDNGEILTEYDMFLLNITCGCYGMSLQDLSFTEGIHKSSGDSQQNVLYRRTIEPLALVYGWILTDCMQNDFDPSLHGDMFIATFGGFEESEDLGALATAYSTLTNSGILGLTNAAKAMKLPEDPDAPHIGRVYMSKDGPIFLDDMANEKVRAAALDAKMAGFALAANPPDPIAQDGNNPPEDGKKAPDDEKATQSQQAQAPKQGAGKDTEKPNQERAVAQGLGRANDATQANDRYKDITPEERQYLMSIGGADAQRALRKLVEERMISQKGSCDCEICRENHGKQVEQGPPYHDGCDCTTKGGNDEPGAQQTTKTGSKLQGNDGGEASQSTTRATGAGLAQHGSAGADLSAAKADYRRWRTRAIEDCKAGRPPRAFSSEVIPASTHLLISEALTRCTTADQVRDVFARAQVQEAELVGGEPLLEFDAKKEIWEPEDTQEQLAAMRSQGAHFLRWNTAVSASGVCATCAPNDEVIVELGQAFPSGHRLPQCHPGCQCNVDLLDKEKKVIR